MAVGGKSIYKVLVKEEFSTMKHSIYKRFFVSHEGLMSPVRDFNASLDMKRCKD